MFKAGIDDGQPGVETRSSKTGAQHMSLPLSLAVPVPALPRKESSGGRTVYFARRPASPGFRADGWHVVVEAGIEAGEVGLSPAR